MDTITFTGQLLVASQNDTCQAINVIFDNMCKSCSNCYDVAIVGIICGAVVLVALFAKIILLHKLETDSEWKTLQAFLEKKKREQDHEWEKEKEKTVRENLIDDREYKKECEKNDREFQNNKEKLQADIEKDKKELDARLEKEKQEYQAVIEKDKKELDARLEKEKQEYQANKDRRGTAQINNNLPKENTKETK